MKKIVLIILAVVMVLVAACIVVLVSVDGMGSDNNQQTHVVNTIEGNLKTYYEMSDGTWQMDGYVYKYRLEITGRMHNAAVDSTFVYLSNLENITFDQAWKAAGLSSNLEDYFDVEEAVLVEMD